MMKAIFFVTIIINILTFVDVFSLTRTFELVRGTSSLNLRLLANNNNVISSNRRESGYIKNSDMDTVPTVANTQSISKSNQLHANKPPAVSIRNKLPSSPNYQNNQPHVSSPPNSNPYLNSNYKPTRYISGSAGNAIDKNNSLVSSGSSSRFGRDEKKWNTGQIFKSSNNSPSGTKFQGLRTTIPWWMREEIDKNVHALPAYAPWWASSPVVMNLQCSLNELQLEAQKRGLDSCGTPEELVDRLNAALENQSLTDDNFTTPTIVPNDSAFPSCYPEVYEKM